MSKFYARFAEVEAEVLVFETEEERDKWVKFEDEFSVIFGDTPENSFLQRKAVSTEEAEKIISKYKLVESSDVTGQREYVLAYVA